MQLDAKLRQGITRRLQNLQSRLSAASGRPVLRTPGHRLDQLAQRVDAAAGRLKAAYTEQTTGFANRFSAAAAALEAMSPEKELARGYAVASLDGKILRSAAEAPVGAQVDLQLAEGRLGLRVEQAAVDSGTGRKENGSE